MRRFLFFLFLLSSLSGHFALAVETGEEKVDPNSAVREPTQDWRERARESFQPEMQILAERMKALTARGAARPYTASINVSRLPVWSGTAAQLQGMFNHLRDQRIYFESIRPQFPRRSTWLYPNDGCYARASHSARAFSNQSMSRPGKVFVFGNLRLSTRYSRNQVVYWWYHVAPAFQVGGRAYILDPGVNQFRPLLLADWLATISARPTSTSVAICDTNAYGPGSICLGGSSRQEGGAVAAQKAFLPREWNLLVSLRMDPNRLLGDFPPWRSNELFDSEDEDWTEQEAMAEVEGEAGRP